MKKYDVAVIGGGFSGVAAAIAAAREGARVIIVEKANCLGGAATNCLVNPFMAYSTKINGKKTALSQGLFKKIHQELKARGAMRGESFLEEELKLLLLDMIEESKIDVLFHASIFKSTVEKNQIKSVQVAVKGGELCIEADYFIDASGDAELAYLSGCPTTLGREKDHLCQPMTLCFRVGNVNVRKFFAGKKALDEAYSTALANGELINPRENILVFKTPIENVLHFNTTRVVKKNPTDPFDVTDAEILAHKQVREIFDFMKKHARGFENAFLMMTASQIGVRESRMIRGEHVLTESECKACTKFPDAIAACNYDIDIHNPEGSGTSHYYFAPGDYYTIPYRSLIPLGVTNLLVAGRCISSDHGAQASYRIMPTVTTIGEAAGTAISLAVKKGVSVRDVDVKELQNTLLANNAFIS